MSASRIPTGTLLRFARDTPYQRTAVVLKDESVLQVKNIESPRESRQHFVSVEEWLLHIEDNTECEYFDQTLNVENLKEKIDDYVSLDAYEDECVSECDSDNESEADSECSWDSDADSDEEDDAESIEENMNYNRNTRTRSATNISPVATRNVNTRSSATRSSAARTVNTRSSATRTATKAPEVRRSRRIANNPRVDYCEIADDVPHATRTHIGKARVEEVRAAKRSNTYNNTSSRAMNPFMIAYTEVLREARASGKKVDYKNVANEARSRYEASKNRA